MQSQQPGAFINLWADYAVSTSWGLYKPLSWLCSLNSLVPLWTSELTMQSQQPGAFINLWVDYAVSTAWGFINLWADYAGSTAWGLYKLLSWLCSLNSMGPLWISELTMQSEQPGAFIKLWADYAVSPAWDFFFCTKLPISPRPFPTTMRSCTHNHNPHP